MHVSKCVLATDSCVQPVVVVTIHCPALGAILALLMLMQSDKAFPIVVETGKSKGEW